MQKAFVQARWFHRGRRGKSVRLVVVHCTVTGEGPATAEAVARRFAAPDARRGSTHLVADSNSVVECVRRGDTAFGAAGANSDGYHLELCGQPTQTREEWLDDYGRAMFALAGPELREVADAEGVPLAWLTPAQVRAGEQGFCTHADVSAAFPEQSTGHWDPGPGFPKDEFMRYVAGQPPAGEGVDVVAEVYAMYRLYLRIGDAEVDASPQMRQDVSFHAWQLSTGQATLEGKRADVEAWARGAGLYP